MKQHRRRNYLVNKSLQLKYALYIFTTLSVVCLAAAACLSFGLWDKILNEFSSTQIRNRLAIATQISDYDTARTTKTPPTTAKRLADIKDVELLSIREKEILENSLRENNLELAAKGILLFAIIALGTIFLTHKIAGPLYRFQKTFEDINKGNLQSRVYLRKGDHAHDLLPHLNSMIGSLDYSFSKIKVLKDKIFEELDNQDISSDNLSHYKHELETELNRYKTSNAFKI